MSRQVGRRRGKLIYSFGMCACDISSCSCRCTQEKEMRSQNFTRFLVNLRVFAGETKTNLLAHPVFMIEVRGGDLKKKKKKLAQQFGLVECIQGSGLMLLYKSVSSMSICSRGFLCLFLRLKPAIHTQPVRFCVCSCFSATHMTQILLLLIQEIDKASTLWLQALNRLNTYMCIEIIRVIAERREKRKCVYQDK